MVHRIVRSVDGIQSVVEVGQKCIITLDVSFAGSGNVTCNINSPHGSDVNIDIIDNHNGIISVVYFPQLPGVYVIHLKFGGQPIPNGQFSQKVIQENVLICSWNLLIRVTCFSGFTRCEGESPCKQNISAVTRVII